MGTTPIYNIPYATPTERPINWPALSQDVAEAVEDAVAGSGTTDASLLTSGTLPGARGVNAGTNTDSFVRYNGNTSSAGRFYGGTTNPSGTTRLNYAGNLHANQFLGSGAGLTALNASNVSSGTLAGARLPAGTVLQVVQATRTTSFAVSSTSPTDWTNITLNITPTSATSTVLVIINAPEITVSAAGNRGFVELVRGTTTLFGRSATHSSDTGRPVSTTLVFMDAPSTTSATTYKARVYNTGGTTTYERGMIIAMEVAG
jgi:hypothetical protein